MDVDFLLVGQGIAGIALAHRLMSAGRTVHIIDQADKNTSSRVAAGLFNPITGRNMVKTWMADQLFPEIQPFYSGLEGSLGVKFFHSLPIYRPFASIEEQNEWMGRSGEAEFHDYIKDVKQSSLFQEVNDPYGGLLLKHSGYVDLNTLMDAFASFLGEKGMITDESLDEGLVEVVPQGIRYKNLTAGALVYTNGLGALNSRFFDWVPLKPNKGELLVVDQDFAPKEIVNRGIFRISLPDGSVKVGSTYSNNYVSAAPTASAREELLEKLGKLVKVSVKTILAHKAGFRPTTIDRRPILGKHPHHDHVYIFNGLGSKGVSLAPYFSKAMLDLLIFEKEPPQEVNISRFFKYI